MLDGGIEWSCHLELYMYSYPFFVFRKMFMGTLLSSFAAGEVAKARPDAVAVVCETHEVEVPSAQIDRLLAAKMLSWFFERHPIIGPVK